MQRALESESLLDEKRRGDAPMRGLPAAQKKSSARSVRLHGVRRDLRVAPQATVSSNSVTVWLTSGEPANHRLGPAGRAPRFEPRPRWPRRSPCASPQTLIRGQPGVRLALEVRYLGGRRHLPIIMLKRAA